MSKYMSVRVSSKDQNPARQIEITETYGIPPENIYVDKISGRKKDRPNYEAMKAALVKGDEVYFKELDRIGRDKSLIVDELRWFKENGIIVRVLDVPTTLMEFPSGQEWVFEMVNNILIEVLGTIAEQEWSKTKKRREEGIAAMPVVDGKKVSSKTGRGFGRPSKRVELVDGESVDDACKRLGISRATYYRKRELMAKKEIGGEQVLR
jgi:DNA invertase Pin-like site-specific DNA recombinase